MKKSTVGVTNTPLDEIAQQMEVLCHEVRSPLLGLSGMVAQLQQDYASDKKLSDQLQVMSSTLKQLVSIAENTMSLSQLENGQVLLSQSIFNLNTLIQQGVQVLQPLAQEKGVQLSFESDLSESQGWVEADETRLVQLLNNLIMNAIKFTQEGEVRVSLSVFERQKAGRTTFKIAVQDEGLGMPPEQVERLFMPYQQFASGQQQLGLGLGLSLVKKLVNLMDGKIEVNSDVGQGSCFTLLLPLRMAETPPLTPANEPSSKYPQFNLNVLVADDADINRRVITQQLKQLGCEVFEAADGEVALSLVETMGHQLDYIFLDWQMPKCNGFETAQAIRQWMQQHAHRLQGIYLQTAMTEEEVVGIKQAEGVFDGCLVKPIEPKHFIEIFSPSEKQIAFKHMQNLDLPEALQPLFPQLIVNLQKQQSTLLEHLANEDWQAASEVLHSMKGEAMMFQQSEWVKKIRLAEAYLQKKQYAAVIKLVHAWSFN